MARLPSTVFLVGLLLVLLAVLPGFSQDHPPSQASADGKCTATVSESAVCGDTLTMKLTLANTSQESVEPELRFQEFYYVDFQKNRKHTGLKDEKGHLQAGPQTSPSGGGAFKDHLKPGDQRILWVKFPAPPGETKTITVCLPGFLPLEEVHLKSVVDPGKARPKDSPKDKNSLEDSQGLPLVGEVVDIVGLSSLGYNGAAVSIDQMMQDLGGKKVGQEIQVALSGDLLFDFDKWDIKKEAEDTLQKLSALVKKLEKNRIIIEGHTDAKGSDRYNLDLSQKRAQAVKAWLQSQGELDKLNFQVKGWGKAKPVAPNHHPDGSDNPEGRAKNRRVEIRF